MRLVVAVLLVAALAACRVTTSQSLGGGVTVRHDVPLEGEEATEDQSDQAQEDDAEAAEDPKPALTIGGGFGTGVSR